VSVGLALGRSRSPIVFRLSADESRQGHRARDLGVAPALAKQRHDTLTVEPSDASSPGRAWRCVVAFRTGIAPPPVPTTRCELFLSPRSRQKARRAVGAPCETRGPASARSPKPTSRRLASLPPQRR
jgi:hypothetical protein